MSQQKVDKYKKEKANRKKIIARQKRQEFFARFAVGVVTIAFFGFIIVSAYFKWFDKKDETTAEAATYSLSEEEISSVWEAYTEESESTSEEETTQVAETTSSEESSSSEEATTVNPSEE